MEGALACSCVLLVAMSARAQDAGVSQDAGVPLPATEPADAGVQDAAPAPEETVEQPSEEPEQDAREREPEPEPEPGLSERDVVLGSPSTLLGERATAWLELGTTIGEPGPASVFAFSTELGFRYRAADALVVDASWGITFAGIRVRGDATISGVAMSYDTRVRRIDPGNPTLRGLFVHRDRAFFLEVGGGLAIPAAARADLGGDIESVAEYDASLVSHRATMSMHGNRAAWRWAPERFSLAIPFRIVVPIEIVVLEASGAFGAMFPVLGDRGVDVDTILELAAGVGVHAFEMLYVGATLAAVGAPTGTTLPAFTLSLEPWVRLRFDPVQVCARGVVNFTGPDGVAGERGPAFGVFVSGGVDI